MEKVAGSIRGTFSVNYVHVTAGLTQFFGISDSSWYRLSAVLF